MHRKAIDNDLCSDALRRTVAARDFPAAGKALKQIRAIIGINLLLGLAVVTVASGGRYIPLG